MKKSIYLFVTVILSLFSTNLYSQAQDFVLVNNTGITIYDLYVAEADSAQWGEDILGDQILNDGEELEINFSGYGDNECLFDILIGDTEGNYFWWEDFNLCELHTITFTADNKLAEPPAGFLPASK